MADAPMGTGSWSRRVSSDFHASTRSFRARSFILRLLLADTFCGNTNEREALRDVGIIDGVAAPDLGGMGIGFNAAGALNYGTTSGLGESK